ncbi:MAG: MerR family transcriptional regulator [Oligoflexia bacterium]|nr:MerR family transcriptional regulator [Oligoflexia bacterium]MBF0365941.1 MerR family transcriptional regulator [Oligoflexia bacterium]
MDVSLDLPRKSFFKAEEVCNIVDIKLNVLRFWESEFKELSPIVSASGQKLYEEREIEVVLLIKKLLVEDLLTMEKAKERLTELVSQLALHCNQQIHELKEGESSLEMGMSFERKVRKVFRAGGGSSSVGKPMAVPVTVTTTSSNSNTNTNTITHTYAQKDLETIVEIRKQIEELISYVDTIKEKHSWNS